MVVVNFIFVDIYVRLSSYKFTIEVINSDFFLKVVMANGGIYLENLNTIKVVDQNSNQLTQVLIISKVNDQKNNNAHEKCMRLMKSCQVQVH